MPGKHRIPLDQAPENGPVWETPQETDTRSVQPTLPAELPTLFTIGHSNLSEEEFLSILSLHSISVLVDVRSAPFSRYVPHFNKSHLEASLPEHQVDYHFAGEWLGGRPPYPDVYKDGKMPDPSVSRPDFLKLVHYEEVMKRDWYQHGIHRLLEIVRETDQQGRRVAIMCSEANPHECHRHHLIARSLIDPKVHLDEYPLVQVKHILTDGSLRLVVATDFVTSEQYKMFP